MATKSSLGQLVAPGIPASAEACSDEAHGAYLWEDMVNQERDGILHEASAPGFHEPLGVFRWETAKTSSKKMNGRGRLGRFGPFTILEVKGVTHDQSIFIGAIRVGRSIRGVTPLERNAFRRPTLDDIRDVSDPLPFLALLPV